jgi:predicted Ser/Thr protein kinase
MPPTVEQFVTSLADNGLMSAAEIAAFRESLPPAQQPKDGQTLAASLVKAGRLTKYQAQAVYQGKSKGLVFGEYVVLDKLGEGGMGVVLKAQHRRMERLVAIKVLSSAAMKQTGAVDRFHREVKAAAKLSHPNIVTAYDASEHQGMHYLAMEYVEGKDLASVVKERGPLGVREAVDYIVQAARGLQYAHEQGIIHRDIKPGNLLLDKRGNVKILDMGLARVTGAEAALGGSDQLTTSGQVLGTCDYMSPEQAMDTHATDHRTDIYALGCSLYRLLTGNPLYRGETMMQILMAHRMNEIPSLCATRPEVPAELDACYQRMVAKEPGDRQATMAEVVAKLEAMLATLSGKPVTVGTAVSPATQAGSPAFVKEVSPRPLVGKGKTAAERRTETYLSAEHGTGKSKAMKARGSGVKVPRQRLLLLGGLASGLVVFLGVVLMLVNREGTLTIDVDEKLGKTCRWPSARAARRSNWPTPRAAGR